MKSVVILYGRNNIYNCVFIGADHWNVAYFL